jgi:SPP1 family predicted phage head-tail adaptor
MKIGLLKTRITILAPIPNKNAIGEQEPKYGMVRQCWARVEGVSGKEVLYGDTVVAQSTHKVWMRYDKTLSVAQRLAFDGRTLTINFITQELGDSPFVYSLLFCSELTT